MQRRSKKSLFIIVALILGFSFLYAYDMPTGGDALDSLYSPEYLSMSPSASYSGGVMAHAFNPAALALEQRPTLDFSWLPILGLGETFTLGSAINAGYALPTAYGVWGFSGHALFSPGNTDFDLGSRFSARATFAKELYTNISFGLGVDGTVGAISAFDWGLNLSLGFQQKLGTLGFLSDARWGVSFLGLGKWYTGGSIGANPQGFTPQMGFNANLFKSDPFTLGFVSDLQAPGFQNLRFSLGLKAVIAKIVDITTSWDFNLRDTLLATSKSQLPAFGISAKIALDAPKDKTAQASTDVSRSEIIPHVGVKQFYGNNWIIGLGVTIPVGLVDANPPKISVTYPESNYPVYVISPNNDGKQDELILPVQITDERYVTSYSLSILDSEGKVVRRIANKEKRPENEGLQAIWERITYVQKGVDVPKELKWDGRTDSGEIAKDGTYFFVIEASDDNNNLSSLNKAEIAVDSTAPSVEISATSTDGAIIFSPDGDGNKDTLKIEQKGSKEDLWLGTVKDAAGTVVKTFKTSDASPLAFSWDGKNDAEQIVPDGVYSYSISSEDRAKNSLSAKIDSIIINTTKAPINLVIDDGQFSPNGDGIHDTMILSPGVPIKTGLSSWTMRILDVSGKEVINLGSKEASTLTDSIPFNGKALDGSVLKEGAYQAELQVLYTNGHNPKALSPLFSIDLTKPEATVKSNVNAFSPNGDDKYDTVSLLQSGSNEELWKGEIRNSSGLVVKTVTFSGKLDSEYVWDGTDDSGKLVKDGQYSYQVKAQDKAGNSFSSPLVNITLDTEKKNLIVTADQKAFSPNADLVKDQVRFSIQIAAPDKVDSWNLSVKDGAGKLVRTWSGKKTPDASIIWDGKDDAGKLVLDASYSATMSAKYVAGDEVSANIPQILVDTVAPKIELANDYTIFSPNGDGKKDTLIIKQSVPANGTVQTDDFEASFFNIKGEKVRTWLFKKGVDNVVWNGTDEAGNKVPDGSYRYVVKSQDLAGNTTEKTITGIVVDTKTATGFITASDVGFSPNGDKKLDDIKLSIIVNGKDGMTSWKVAIADETGKVRKEYSGKDAQSLPNAITWDGKGTDGTVVQATYVATLSAQYERGDEIAAKSQAFILDTEGPALSANVSPKNFSPDNDGVDDELTIAIRVEDKSKIVSWRLDINEQQVDDGSQSSKNAAARNFVRFEGQGMPAPSIVWDGRSSKGELVEGATDYPYTISVVDELGNERRISGIIAVDVLVVMKGDKLMIKVPSIVFRTGAADFNGLDKDKLDKNEYVLKRIAAILNRYRDYKITILGHANSISKISGGTKAQIDAEEARDLIPLSKSRADAIRRKLIEFGVDATRLSSEGAGSSEPVVDFKDAENRWKNRRVEFLLNK